MKKYYFTKLAGPMGAPMWIRVPGTPITLPGRQTQYERLPGMTQWASRGVIERMAEGLDKKIPTSDLVAQEENKGLGHAATIGGGIGGLLGAGAGRLIGGEAAAAPFLDVLKQGINRRTFSSLRNLPKAMKALPLLGAGAGALAGYRQWDSAKPARKETANQVARGLLTEQVLQQSDILSAARNVQKDTPPVLSQIKNESAHQASPYLATSGNMGV